jgi:hypothetical protein
MSQQHLTSTQTYLQLVDVSIMRLHVFKTSYVTVALSVRSCITIPYVGTIVRQSLSLTDATRWEFNVSSQLLFPWIDEVSDLSLSSVS